FRQAVMVLRWFRGERDIPKLGRDHKVSRATAYRYIDEGIAVLAAQAPDLHGALERARNDGHAYLIMDGTLLPTDRCAEQTISVKSEQIDLWYSGKAHQHAGNIQALSSPAGWTAPAMLEAQVVGSQPARGAVPRDRWNVSSYSRGGMFPQ